MKKLVLALTLFSFFLISTYSFAQENSSSDSAQTSVDYILPYPGLLPDSPFYFLRATRDRVISFLITEPLKKAEFDLLQADKMLSAGIYLGDKKKYELAVTSISKGENYFESAIAQAVQARKEGKPVGDIAAQLYNSARKHQEVLKELETKTSGSLRASFVEEEKRAAVFEKKAKLILSQK